MNDRRNKRNSPIATLIKNYVNKKSGKVAGSREEIKWRFKALDWKDQKKILSAFLDAGKVDRHWAYSELLDLWDSSFESKVKELWEQYHEQRCKWVVIRYLPLDYVRQHMQDFTEERDYYFACLRLAKDKDYVIERGKLSLTDYLAVLYHSGRGVEEKEGLDILYQIVHDYCVKGIDEYEVNTSREDMMGSLACPIHLRDIRLATYYLEKADCCKPVLEFEEWNEKVQKAINDSEERKRLHSHHFANYNYERRKLDILRKYAYLTLGDKYKKPSDPPLNEMLRSVEEYALDNSTYDEVFSMRAKEESILGSSPMDSGEEMLPF